MDPLGALSAGASRVTPKPFRASTRPVPTHYLVLRPSFRGPAYENQLDSTPAPPPAPARTPLLILLSDPLPTQQRQHTTLLPRHGPTLGRPFHTLDLDLGLYRPAPPPRFKPFAIVVQHVVDEDQAGVRDVGNAAGGDEVEGEGEDGEGEEGETTRGEEVLCASARVVSRQRCAPREVEKGRERAYPIRGAARAGRA